MLEHVTRNLLAERHELSSVETLYHCPAVDESLILWTCFLIKYILNTTLIVLKWRLKIIHIEFKKGIVPNKTHRTNVLTWQKGQQNCIDYLWQFIFHWNHLAAKSHSWQEAFSSHNGYLCSFSSSMTLISPICLIKKTYIVRLKVNYVSNLFGHKVTLMCFMTSLEGRGICHHGY